MWNKVFKNMLGIVLVTVIISSLIFIWFFYRNSRDDLMKSNKNDINYLKYIADNYGQDAIEELEVSRESRITIISENGDVLYDSVVDSKSMENHLDRPEVKKAFESGYGEDVRKSATLSKENCYVAVKLENGAVIRLSVSTDSVYKTVVSMLPLMLCLIVLLIIMITIVSRIITDYIIKPINEINLDDPSASPVYDEMLPLVKRIKSQSETISEQVENLREKTIEFEAITENMNEGFIIIDKKSDVLSYNKSAIKLLEVTNETHRLHNILEFNRRKRFQRVAAEALTGVHSECILSIGDKIYQIMANPVTDDEEVKGAVILIIDATEKEKREQLRREFSANVSHELKTPLTSISGYAEIIKSGIAKNEDIIKFSEIIHAEAARLVDLIGDIIDISKLDENTEQFVTEIVSISSLTQDVKNRLESKARKRNVEINVDVFGETNIVAVRQIVDEIVYNLIENAVKYNKDGGRVNVVVGEKKDSVEIIVSDTGIGIPKGDLDRVFERFYRVDKSHSKSVGGTGLGLSIVKHGATYLGATLELDSEEGVGTTIKVTFKKIFEF